MHVSRTYVSQCREVAQVQEAVNRMPGTTWASSHWQRQQCSDMASCWCTGAGLLVVVRMLLCPLWTTCIPAWWQPELVLLCKPELAGSMAYSCSEGAVAWIRASSTE
jgi:hypothetical protein